ncbi:hypothetical protein M3Y94_00650000 [Aphelenchoides besseyi]|nr:hypothetical protein M3Y94_00650000 [Aphelenchoides besseyi]
MATEDQRSQSSEKNEELMQDLLECYNDVYHITASQLQARLEDLNEDSTLIENEKDDEKSEPSNLKCNKKEEPTTNSGTFVSTQRRNSLSDDELFSAAMAQVEEETETSTQVPVKSNVSVVPLSTSNLPRTTTTSAVSPKSHVTVAVPSTSIASTTSKPAIQRSLTFRHQQAPSPILRPSVIHTSIAPQRSFTSTTHPRQRAPSSITRPAIAHFRPPIRQPPTSMVRPSTSIIIPPNTRPKGFPPQVNRQNFVPTRSINPSSSVVIRSQINHSRQNASRPNQSQRQFFRPPPPVLISSRASVRSTAPLIPAVRSPAAVPNKRVRADEVDDFYDDAVSAMFFEDLLRENQDSTGNK